MKSDLPWNPRRISSSNTICNSLAFAVGYAAMRAADMRRSKLRSRELWDVSRASPLVRRRDSLSATEHRVSRTELELRSFIICLVVESIGISAPSVGDRILLTVNKVGPRDDGHAPHDRRPAVRRRFRPRTRRGGSHLW